MFCFQCEQTAGSVGCMGKAGVCGKQASTANLQDDLTGAMIGLAQVAELSKPTDSTTKVMLEGLFTTITNVNFDDEVLQKRIADVHREKALLGAKVDFPDYKMWDLWDANEDVRSLKSLILLGLRGVAAYAYHAWMLGYKDEEVNAFFYKGMAALANKDKAEDLLPLVMETGRINFKCMEMLDKANTESYGTPVPTTVPLMVEKGPFIVVTGHDLKDLPGSEAVDSCLRGSDTVRSNSVWRQICPNHAACLPPVQAGHCADGQLKRPSLRIGHHPAHLSHLVRLQSWGRGHWVSPIPRTEHRQGQHDIDPPPSGWLENGLVVHTVQHSIHAQIEFVALAVTAHLQSVADRALIPQGQIAVPHAGKAATVVAGDLPRKHSVAVLVK